MAERDWLTLKEAADLACISQYSLQRYLKKRKNKPPHYRLVPGGRVRFPKEQFLQWTTGGSQEAKQNV